MPNPTSKLNLVINGVTTQLDIHDANAVDLTNNQTVAGNKEFTGTTTAHDLVPSATDTYNLGTSTNKWKSFNGLNPGALSLPSVSSGINLDLTNFKMDGSDNKFRLTNFSNYPYDNGWLFVRLNGCTRYYLDHWYKVVSNSYANPSEAIFFLPINDKDHDITLRCVCTSIIYIKVFPCQGDV